MLAYCMDRRSRDHSSARLNCVGCYGGNISIQQRQNGGKMGLQNFLKIKSFIYMALQPYFYRPQPTIPPKKAANDIPLAAFFHW